MFSARRCKISVANEYEHAEQVVADVALLHDMAAGRLDERRVRQAAEVLLERKRNELPSVSVAVAARLLEVSRTTVETWRQAGILMPAIANRRRHEVTTDSLVRLLALLGELRRLGKDRDLRDYVWWSAQDTADYADGMLAEALRQLHSSELGGEYIPSEKDLAWARREINASSWKCEPPIEPDLARRFEDGLRQISPGMQSTEKARRERR